MKNIFLLLFFCLFFLSVKSQSDSALKSRIDTLKSRLDEKNYTRIPNSDFESILDQKVKDEIQDQGKYWLAFLFGLATLMGFLAKFYFTKNTGEQVAELVKQQLAPITAKVDALTQDQKTFMTTSTDTIDDKIDNTLSFIWDDIADSMVERAKSKQFQGQDLINSIRNFLDSTLKLSPEKKILMIDTLMRCYFEINGFEKMIGLIKEYETHYGLIAETYMNAAIALCNYYEYYGLDDYRIGCMENCRKAIGKSPDYGTAYMVELEVNMIYYKYAGEDKTKQNEALETVRTIFQNIENNKSEFLPKGIIDRFDQDKPYGYLKPFLDELENLFPKDLARIRERAAIPPAAAK